MTLRTTVLALLFSVLLTACARNDAPRAAGSAQEPTPAAATAGAPGSLAGAALPHLERKITRDAELVLESDDPYGTQTAARAIAENLGGYVASSDASQHGGDVDDALLMTTMVMRIPSDHFSVALERLKAVAVRVASERVNAEDVTEDFIDLNARLVSEKALEAQFVELLKQSKSVKDALEVHTQLASVRSDIDKLEGRRQFLEGKTSLSTIRLVVKRHTASAVGWFDVGHTVKRAASDAAETSAAIVHGAIRILGFAAPVFALVVLPALLMTAAVVRRARRARSQ